MKQFTLEVVTQEKHLLTQTIDSLTVPTQAGEITILADHAPLFSRLKAGELTYQKHQTKTHFAVSGGFIDVSPTNIVTVLADSALRSDEINLKQAQLAIESARKAIEESTNTKHTLQMELELRKAIVQANVARKHQRSTSQ